MRAGIVRFSRMLLVMRFVLGFDGGGTKTECVVMDSSERVCARSRGGPANPTRVGFDDAAAAVCAAGRSAMQEARVPVEQVVALCAGLGGVWRPESEKKMQGLLEREFPGKIVRVCTDLELTLEAVGVEPAIVLVAGTGSGAIGRDSSGRLVRVGGHGRFLGDEGSAFAIGQRATIGALRELDRTGQNSELGIRILREFATEDWEEFKDQALNMPDQVFPRIFSVVVAAAGAGDSTSREHLREAAKELASLVGDLVRRLGLQGRKFVLAKSGGMLGRSSYFDQQIEERLREVAPEAVAGALRFTPAEAAAHMVLRFVA